MEIIPAIDLIGGKCVRLSQGNYSSCKIYSDSPLDVAKAFEDAGIRRLHLVDLDGAKTAALVNLRILENLCTHTSLTVDFGGGIQSEEDLRAVFQAGAAFACIGSMAQTAPDQVGRWLEQFGRERLIISADVWNRKVCIRGWRKVTDTGIDDLIDRYGGKIRYLMCTDIVRDGMLAGASVKLYEELVKRYPELNVIASGGISSLEDIRRLAASGVSGAVIGKAIYEKKIGLKSLKV